MQCCGSIWVSDIKGTAVSSLWVCFKLKRVFLAVENPSEHFQSLTLQYRGHGSVEPHLMAKKGKGTQERQPLQQAANKGCVLL